MPSKLCELCGASFSFQPYRALTARFCSGSCRAKWLAKNLPSWGGRGMPKPSAIGNRYRVGMRPENGFTVGHVPWNKNLKGIRMSPATEFKPGPRPAFRAPIGAVSIRKAGHSHRAFVKIAHPNKWRRRAVNVWEEAHGPIPKGSVVHHLDRDPLNDALSNLQCLTRAEHALEHANDAAVLAHRFPGFAPRRPPFP